MYHSVLKFCIVSAVGGLSEFVQDKYTGIIVQPDSEEALAEGIISYFELRDEIDFEKNITDALNNNKFSELPGLINKIIDEPLALFSRIKL